MRSAGSPPLTLPSGRRDTHLVERGGAVGSTRRVRQALVSARPPVRMLDLRGPRARQLRDESATSPEDCHRSGAVSSASSMLHTRVPPTDGPPAGERPGALAAFGVRQGVRALLLPHRVAPSLGVRQASVPFRLACAGAPAPLGVRHGARALLLARARRPRASWRAQRRPPRAARGPPPRPVPPSNLGARIRSHLDLSSALPSRRGYGCRCSGLASRGLGFAVGPSGRGLRPAAAGAWATNCRANTAPVAVPTIPSTARPWPAWKRSTAASVRGPKRPSSGPGRSPARSSCFCSARTRSEPFGSP